MGFKKRLLVCFIILLYSIQLASAVPTIISTDPTDQQNFPLTTTSVPWTIITNEAATCRHDGSDRAYSSMTNTFSGNGTTTHTSAITYLGNPTRTRYVRCQDTTGNAMTTSLSVTISWSTPPPSSNPGDLNNDSIVDIMDIMIIVPDIGKTSGYDARADVNNDGMINIFDLVRVAKHWGTNYGGPPPTCNNGQTQQCGSSNIGACQFGTQTCNNNQWGTCTGNIEPTTETCNTIDDNCDGQTDEGGVCNSPPPPGSPPTLPSGLVLAYGFDEGTGALTTDSSGNGNIGTIVSGSWTTGKYLNALSFDGTTSWVDAGSHTTIDDVSPQTITMWVNPNTLTGYLISKRDVCTGAWRLGSRPGWFKVFTGTDPHTQTSNTLPTNTWTHLALTWDGTTSPARIYLNGIESGYSTFTTGSGTLQSDASCTLRIGSREGTSAFFNGLIDEVRMYNRVLSLSEITTDMNTPTNTQIPPPPIDSTPPAISNAAPTGARSSGTTILTMTATTDEAATCKWSTTDQSYSTMPNTFTTTGTTTHSETITGLQDGQSYTRYIRCQDNSGNSNPTSLQIDFNILTPGQTPPPPTGADIFLDFNDPTNLGVTCGSNNPCVWPWRKHDYWPTGGVSGSGAINMHWSPNMVVGSSPVYVRTGSTARHFRISYRVKQSAIMSTSGSRQKVMRLWSDNPFRAVGMLENTRGNLCWHWEGWDTRPLSSCVGIGQGTFNDNQWHTYTIEVDYRNTADFVVTLSFDGVVVRTLHLDASAAGNLYNGLLIVSPMVEMFSCGVVSGPCGAGNPTVAGDYTVDDFTFTVLP